MGPTPLLEISRTNDEGAALALDPISLARTLIDIPSTTGEEGGVSAFLEKTLSEMGFTVTRQEIEEGRFNILAVTDQSPRVILCSHTDTVPPFIPSSEDDDYIYGRGACDTKGIIAAMLAAGELLFAGDVRDFGFLFVVGEETDSIGAKLANGEVSSLGSRFVIVGEPTGSRFVRASKGAFTATLRFHGIAAHSAHPERGDSAILKMVAALAEISAFDWGRHPILGDATANIGIVRGGDRPNVVPALAEAEMIFRTVDPPAIIEEKLRSIAQRNGGEIVRCHGNPPTFMAVPEGESSIVVAFNTDVPHLNRLGKPLLYGPGSILDAHGADEKISKREILQAVETYRRLVSDLLSGKAISIDVEN